MNEKNIIQKDDMLFQKKNSSKNSCNTSFSKLVNPKKELITTKITSKIDINKKEVYISRKQKSTSSNIKSSKTLDKNYYYNLMKEIPSGGKNLTNSSTLNVSLNDHQDKNNNSIKRKPIISNNKNDEKIIVVNNKSKNSDNSKNKAGLKNSRNIRINIIIKTSINKDKKNNCKVNKKIKEENDIYNFITEECDENINENDIIPNSRKHCSLTNPSIFPCISFSNPFTNNNNNININENNGKNLKQVKSMNINNNNFDMGKNHIQMENNYLENLDIINVFKDNENIEEADNILNISNLDNDLDQIDEELEEINIQQYPVKSFIQFNNNLSLKLSLKKSRITPSYKLALYPKLFLTKKIKDIIKENYEVKEPIFEEVDSYSKTPKTSKNKISFEENNTKYSTKDKNSDRNKNYQDFKTEDNSYNEDTKKDIINYEKNNDDTKYKQNIHLKKNIKKIKENNKKKNLDEKGGEGSRINIKTSKNMNINNIYIETKNIVNITDNYNDFNNQKSIKDICYKYTYKGHNSINSLPNEPEKNFKNKNCILNKLKNTSNKETHQKAKSLVPNINLSTLYLYETIQTNQTKFNNSHSKKKNKLKINSNGNEILNKEKKIIDDYAKKDLLSERQRKSKSKKNNKNYIKKNSNYKDKDYRNKYHTSYSNTNINNNKNQVKGKNLGKINKSSKNQVNSFISCFVEKKDKTLNNNELNYTYNDLEYKYPSNYDFSTKRDSKQKKSYINRNAMDSLNSEQENIKNIKKGINMTHHKKISEQFVDNFNVLLDIKTDNNTTLDNHKLKLSQDSKTNYKNQTINKILNKNNLNLHKKNLLLNNSNSYNKIKNMATESAHIISYHKKSKTFFISPSYTSKKSNAFDQSQNFYNRINNNLNKKRNTINIKGFSTENQIKNNQKRSNDNKKLNNYSSKNNNVSKTIISINNKSGKNNNIKGKNKFKEIKKNIGENIFVKINHKKTNTIGNTTDLSYLCQNLFNYNNLIQNINNSNNQCMFNNNKNKNIIYKNNQHKKAASINNLINNLDNKKKIICALQRIKFIPVSYYSKIIKEMTQINSNLLIILVYKGENQKFVFRGLYEVDENEPQKAKIIFAPNCELGVINVDNVNNFFNYSISRGEFIRYKFIGEINKKFNEDTILVF